MSKRFTEILIYWTLAYALVGVCFAILYAMLPKDSLLVPQDAGEHGAARLATFLHFSFVTQATVGYGDIVPAHWARAVADLQAVAGLALNAVLLGAVATSFLNYHASLEFPRFLVYEKARDVFWFRYINCDVDWIVDGRIGVSLSRELETKYSIESAPVSADYQTIEMIKSLSNCALKTTSNNGTHVRDLRPTIDSEPLVLSPLNLLGGAVVRLAVSGRYGVTGNGLFTVKEYKLDAVRCGSHQRLDDRSLKGISLVQIRRLLNREPTPTFESVCLACEFLELGCPLDVAVKLRGKLEQM